MRLLRVGDLIARLCGMSSLHYLHVAMAAVEGVTLDAAGLHAHMTNVIIEVCRGA